MCGTALAHTFALPGGIYLYDTALLSQDAMRPGKKMDLDGQGRDLPNAWKACTNK